MDVVTDAASVPAATRDAEVQAEIDAARAQLKRAEYRLFCVVGSGRLGNWGLTSAQITKADRLRRECRKARERLDAALAASARSAQADLSTLPVTGLSVTATPPQSDEIPATVVTQADWSPTSLFSHRGSI